jgi:hypothetical protein
VPDAGAQQKSPARPAGLRAFRVLYARGYATPVEELRRRAIMVTKFMAAKDTQNILTCKSQFGVNVYCQGYYVQSPKRRKML